MEDNLSKKKIDQLGVRLSEDTPSKEDLDLLQEYRRSFGPALARTFEKLTTIAKQIDSQSIVTYRIKRIDSIIRKLKRFKNTPNGRMCLQNMGDIAGCRCILQKENTDNIYKVKEELEKVTSLRSKSENNYITKPKLDGYRSLHEYANYENPKRVIEIQIRNQDMHNWATLVEIIDVLYTTKIKEGENSDNQLKRFLLLFSKKNELSFKEKEELINIAESNELTKKMSEVFSQNYINIRLQWIKREKKGGEYFIISADENAKSSIQSYEKFEEAEDAYFSMYLQYPKSNIVLTRIKNVSFKKISRAYSNYMLAIHDFFVLYPKILDSFILDCIKQRKRIALNSAMTIYKNNYFLRFNNFKNEVSVLINSRATRTISSNELREWVNDLTSLVRKWNKLISDFSDEIKKTPLDPITRIILKYHFTEIAKKNRTATKEIKELIASLTLQKNKLS